MGDCAPDGKVDSTDVITLKRHILSVNKLEGVFADSVHSVRSHYGVHGVEPFALHHGDGSRGFAAARFAWRDDFPWGVCGAGGDCPELPSVQVSLAVARGHADDTLPPVLPLLFGVLRVVHVCGFQNASATGSRIGGASQEETSLKNAGFTDRLYYKMNSELFRQKELK